MHVNHGRDPGAPIPPALLARPRDERRGLPIPPVSVHSVADGEAVDFTTINGPVAVDLARARRCSLCGEAIGYWIAFLGGPAAHAARRYLDPPGHPECMSAAVRLCPFIAVRRYRRTPTHRQAVVTADLQDYEFDQPEEWVLGITRSFRIEINHGVAAYLPAPFTSRHHYRYDEQGRIFTGPL
ncbi:MAG: hypothetical protein HOW97_14455 [Catenulispora sp.]|nr:hypothetical protein [Catenulispora sp.]NUR61434.1 hypothetical protein [Catenulispora sp.]